MIYPVPVAILSSNRLFRAGVKKISVRGGGPIESILMSGQHRSSRILLGRFKADQLQTAAKESDADTIENLRLEITLFLAEQTVSQSHPDQIRF